MGLAPIAALFKDAIAGEVRAVFKDGSRRRADVKPGTGLFASHSVVRRVHADVTTMMVGGVAALLLQMLHPAVLAGVWDHSDFRHDMLGRLRRTASFISVTTYGDRRQAESAIGRVRLIHEKIEGALADGTPYAANDPKLLAWVHVCEATSFIDAWMRYANPFLSRTDQDAYFADMAQIAEALGADPVPRSRAEAMRLIGRMRAELACDRRTREVARLVLSQRAETLGASSFQAIATQAAIDLLPVWARRMHGLAGSRVTRPLVHAGTFGLARTIRWALN